VARIYLRKTLTGFEPADDPSRLTHRKYQLGKIYRADVVRPRSYRHHCLGMALLQLTYDNQDRYTDFETFRKAIARAAGHVVSYSDIDGNMCHDAASLSYDAIPDDVEFGNVLTSMLQVCAHLLHDISIPELEQEVLRYVDSHYGRAS
jgi:hypothetical protein